MDFRLLGPLEVAERGRTIPLGGARQRTVLAHLLIRANQVVPTDRLIDEVWGEETPEAARKSLQAYVSRLRKALGDGARIEGRAAGYLLRAGPDEVDAQRFEALLHEARGAEDGDPEAALGKLTDALDLFRGSPLVDLADEPSLQGEIARLEELRTQAVEERVSCQLALGRHSEVIGQLRAEVERHPLREGLWAHLMAALYRAGRQGEALEAYQRAREVLAEELGIDPSPELRELHERILRQELPEEPRGRRLRGYRLLEQIGRGGFGVVYRATQPQVGRDVAVKVIRPELANDSDFTRRFEAEAQMVARLEHPHIVPLYDYWREPNAAYLVMRWLRGGSLRARLAERRLEPEEAAGLLDQVASALAAAHRQGVVHRDVKPGNILLDEEGNAYLSDFGIARDVAAAEQVVPTSPDTTGYLSPEQLRGEPTTARADIYSLGVVLYEALTGRHPFPGAESAELKRLHVEAPLPSLRGQGEVLPPAVDPVIQRATAKEPSERFTDALAVAVAFREALGQTRAGVAVEVVNPYKGLRPFHEADAADFFGREALTDRLVARLAEPEPRFIAVVGPSGSGKSSVVRAGLVPALRRGAVLGSRDWFVAEMVPGTHPMRELETALLRVAVEPPVGLLEELEHDERGLGGAVDRILPPGSRVVLIVDQFEEAFTLVADEEHRRHFLASLVAAATEPGGRIRIVVTLRADFYDRPLRYRGLGELIRAGSELVLPLSPDELERAIANPAARVGVAPEPGLVPGILSEVSDQPGSLPLLQYTLTELFERRNEGVLTVDAYHRIGGVSGALVRRAEEIYRSLDDEGRAASRQLFLRLVALGEGSEDTRRRVPRAEVLSLEEHAGAMQRVIDAYGRHRLLSFDRDPETRGPTVEVAHEALLTAWGRLQGWIDSARDDLRTHRRLAAAAGEWAAAGRDPSFLLGGARLGQFESWASTSEMAMASVERGYLDASLAAREAARAEEEARQRKESALRRRSINRLRALVAVLAVAALVAGGLTFFAFDQRQEARDQAARAEAQARAATARELASAAVANLEVDPELSILLALRAVDVTESAEGTVLREAEEALRRALHTSRVELSVPGSFGAAFSPDGTTLAVSDEEGSVTFWDVATGAEIRTVKVADARIIQLEFMPDATQLISTSEEGLVRLWEAETGETVKTFRVDRQEAFSMSLSADGTKVAARGRSSVLHVFDIQTGQLLLEGPDARGMHFHPDGNLIAVGEQVWDVTSGRSVFTVPTPEEIEDVRFSPDGRWLATAGQNGIARVWNLKTGDEKLELVGHESSVDSVDFSPDGSLIATGSSDGTVRVWDAEAGTLLMVLSGQGGSVSHVTFHPGGELLAGAGTSGTTKVWNVAPEGNREVLTFKADEGIVFSATYSPDGRNLVTAGEGGAVNVWDRATGELEATIPARGALSFDARMSPDASRIVSGGIDGAAVWDLDTGDRVLELGSETVSGVRYSRDGRLVATAGRAGVFTWDADSGDPVSRFGEHRVFVLDVEFSPDGSTAVSVGDDEILRAWDPRSGEPLYELEGHTDSIISVVFSPDGRTLASAGGDGTARVWDVESGTSRSLEGHSSGVTGVAFSPDGSLLATSSFDGTAKLWDPDTGEELLTLFGHEKGASFVAFSPDGKDLAVAGEDGTVRIYAVELDDVIQIAESRRTRSLTDAECLTYLHVEPCPAS